MFLLQFFKGDCTPVVAISTFAVAAVVYGLFYFLFLNDPDLSRYENVIRIVLLIYITFGIGRSIASAEEDLTKWAFGFLAFLLAVLLCISIIEFMGIILGLFATSLIISMWFVLDND